MRRIVFCLLASALVATCATNPQTGRSQLILVSEEAEIAMGLEAFQEISKNVTFETDPRLLEPLERVGRAIAAAANRPDYEWEFKLIRDDKTANAFVLPGGKICLYTGIYPILQDEAAMAIVMGHEVEHAVLRHAAERMSQQRLAAVGVAAAGAAADKENREAWTIALGAGATLGVLLPYSRKHESEADQYGLYIAARAGYDPQAAVGVWERLAAQGGSRPPEFLSTHPDPLNRVERMRRWMPEATAIYERSDKKRNRLLPAIR
jgi:predicted Zn-dependent protease